jgi:NTE family protein
MTVVARSMNEERLVAPACEQQQSVFDAFRTFPSLAPLFEPIGEELLADIEAMVDWFGIPAGSRLFNEGDPASDVYIVLTGRLGVFVAAETEMIPVAQISPGELIGEMSLISEEPRSATALALRDTEVVRVPREAVTRLMDANSQVGFFVMRLLAARLRERTRTRLLRQTIDSIAIVSLTEPLADPEFPERLSQAFSKFGRAVTVIDYSKDERESDWLRLAAQRQQLVVYSAGRHSSAWERHCIRQSDRVVFVANAGSGSVGAKDWAIDCAAELHRAADLVLINDAKSVLPSGGTEWLQRFSSDRILHVRLGDAGDIARVARLVLRQAIGLVFSGGGARAFAHIGVIKAFAEAGIPIDLVAGTSMGALIAASVALGHAPEQIIEHFLNAFKTNPIADYTIPIVALTRGRRMRRLLLQHCGEAQIENTWKNFFCVSTNLSSGEVMIHNEGFLWRALRASSAIPGVVPPMVMDGQVFVDGGIMNNFPASVMGSLLRGPVVGVDVTSDWRLETQTSDIEDKSLFWLLRKGRREAPNIVRILTRSGTVSGDLQTAANRAAADLLIRPELGSIEMWSFRALHEAVDLGYRAAEGAIEQIKRGLATETVKWANFWR